MMRKLNRLGVLGFEGFKIKCIIGLEPHERQNEQEIIVDLKVEVDVTPAALTDNLRQTIDYVQLASMCKEIAEQGRFQLLERYAFEVLDAIFSNFSPELVWICVKKPSAIVGASCAFVEMTRSKVSEV